MTPVKIDAQIHTNAITYLNVQMIKIFVFKAMQTAKWIQEKEEGMDFPTNKTHRERWLHKTSVHFEGKHTMFSHVSKI